MHSEIEIREAVVQRIKEFTATPTPAPIVLGRDIAGDLESATPHSLKDEAGAVHVITVTQRSMLPIEPRQGGTLYELIYAITQYKQFRSGSDLSNSDREASLERDAIVNAFRYTSELPPILKFAQVQPVGWLVGSLNKQRLIPGGQVWISTAILRARNYYGVC